MPTPEVKYQANFDALVSAFSSVFDPTQNKLGENAEEASDSAIHLVISAFKQISCFGLRVKFTDRDNTVRVNYLPTLSGFRLSKRDKENCCGDNTVEFGESSPPHLRNIFTASLMQQLMQNGKVPEVNGGWIAVLF